MVAVASASTHRVVVWRGALGWTAAAAAVIVLGVAARLVFGGGGIGDRSAALMIALLATCAWVGVRLVNGPRGAFFVTLGVVAVLQVAALPTRDPPEYDQREALYRTDQLIAARVPVEGAVLVVVAEPVFQGSAPAFAVGAVVNGTALAWTCPFRHGVQRLALPVPQSTLAAATTADVQLRLRGTPSREADHLLVYGSAQQGGFLMSLVSPTQIARAADAVNCTLD